MPPKKFLIIAVLVLLLPLARLSGENKNPAGQNTTRSIEKQDKEPETAKLKAEIARLKEKISQLESDNTQVQREINEVLELGFRARCGKNGRYPEHDSTVPRVTHPDEKPKLIKKVQPDPDWLKYAHFQGIVLLEAEIDKHGNVVRACVISGHPIVTRYAIKALLQWKYQPYKINGTPSPSRFVVQIRFSYSDYHKEK